MKDSIKLVLSSVLGIITGLLLLYVGLFPLVDHYMEKDILPSSGFIELEAYKGGFVSIRPENIWKFETVIDSDQSSTSILRVNGKVFHVKCTQVHLKEGGTLYVRESTLQIEKKLRK